MSSVPLFVTSYSTLFTDMRISFFIFGKSDCKWLLMEMHLMAKKYNEEAIKKIAAGMKKASEKYGIPSKKKSDKKK